MPRVTGNPRNAIVCDMSYLQNEFSDPQFFYIFNTILSFSTYTQSLQKICMWELLGTNVLKWFNYKSTCYFLLSSNHCNIGHQCDWFYCYGNLKQIFISYFFDFQVYYNCKFSKSLHKGKYKFCGSLKSIC